MSDELCTNCNERFSKHVDGKCLYEPTEFSPARCFCGAVLRYFNNGIIAGCSSCNGVEQATELERGLILGIHEN